MNFTVADDTEDFPTGVSKSLSVVTSLKKEGLCHFSGGTCFFFPHLGLFSASSDCVLIFGSLGQFAAEKLTISIVNWDHKSQYTLYEGKGIKTLVKDVNLKGFRGLF